MAKKRLFAEVEQALIAGNLDPTIDEGTKLVEITGLKPFVLKFDEDGEPILPKEAK